MAEVETQVRELVRASFEAIPVVGLDDVLLRRPDRPRGRRPVLAAVAALLVVAVVGTISWLGARQRADRGPGPALGGARREPAVVHPEPTRVSPTWSVDLGGPIGIPPVVVKDAVVVVGTDGDGPPRIVRALDTRSGAVRWEQSALDADVVAAPVAAGDLVLVLVDDDRLVALDAGSGAIRWTAQTGHSVKAPAPPLVVGSKAYLGAQDGLLQALDLRDARELWHRRLGEAIHATPTLARDELYVATGELPFGPESRGGVYALDAASGGLRWHEGLDGPVLASPAVGSGVVAVTTTDFSERDRAALVVVDASGRPRTEVRYKGPLSAPVVRERVVVVSTSAGTTEARAASEPDDLVWRVRIGATDAATQVVRRGSVIAAGADIVGIDPQSGRQRWRARVPGAYLGEHRDTSRVLVISRLGRLGVLDAGSGRVLAYFDLHDTPVGASLAGASVYWASAAGVVSAASVVPAPAPALVECPDSREPEGGNVSPDALPARGSTDEAQVRRVATEQAGDIRARFGGVESITVAPRNGRVWYENPDGSISTERLADYQIVVELESPDTCPSSPWSWSGVPLKFVAPG